MTDILLIHPPKHDYGISIFKGFDTYAFLSHIAPLGLLYVAASCREKGYAIKVLDMEAEKISLYNVRKYLRLYSPRAIGITVTAPVAMNSIAIAKGVKEEMDIPVIVGGPHPTLCPESMLESPYVDYAVRYEGEDVLPGLLDFVLKGKGRLEEIKNISYRKNGVAVHNETAPLRSDIDSLPFPARELVPVRSCFSVLAKKVPSVGIFGSRGCPYRCIFCSSVYKTSRRRSPRNVVDEIETVIKEHKVRNFDFFDPVFNLDKQWSIDLCNEIIRRGVRISWRARCRPDLIQESLVRKMKEAGCHIVSLSIESANNETLKFLRKGYSIEDVARAIKVIRDYGMDIHAYFILGCPNETPEDMSETIRFAKEAKIDYADFHILTALAGSDLYGMAEANEAGLVHPALSCKQIKKIYLKALLSFYLRPFWIVKECKRTLRNPNRYIGLFLYFVISLIKAQKNRFILCVCEKENGKGGAYYGKEDIVRK